MKFVEITPPEAGKLDEHHAVVALTQKELERLRTAADWRWTDTHEEPYRRLRTQLSDVQDQLERKLAEIAGEDA